MRKSCLRVLQRKARNAAVGGDRCAASLEPQRGAVLPVTLIALTGMILAATSLTRSLDTAGGIAGNLAFQQASAATGDVGVEAAIGWLEANRGSATLNTDQAASGYTASRRDPAAGQTWDQFWTSVLVPAGQTVPLAFDCASQAPDPAGACTTDASGNRISYAIQRMCVGAGAPAAAGVDCSASPATNTTGSGKGSGTIALQADSQVYYRITVRIDGPRNALNYLQATIAM
jgi:type IV pilus assembly protein PilX